MLIKFVKDQLTTGKENLVFYKKLNLSIAFRGELFNVKTFEKKYQKKTEDSSLTFLLGLAYKEEGPSFVKEMNGHFSIVVLDHSQQVLRCYNDRYNTIPVYFCPAENDSLIIGNRISEVCHNRKGRATIDWASLFFVAPEDKPANVIPTLVKEVSMLDGGSYLEWNFSSFSGVVKSYWSILNREVRGLEIETSKTVQALIEEYQFLISQAVLDRTTDTDLLATQLSGGFDSSIVSIIAGDRYKIPAVSALTVNSMVNNELDRAQQISQERNLDHYLSAFSLKEKITPGDWRQTVLTTEQVDCSLESFVKNQLLVHTRTLLPNVKYMLSGYGSDQLNGGLTVYNNTGDQDQNENWEAFYRNLSQEQAKDNRPLAYEFYHFGRHFLKRKIIHEKSNRVIQDPWLIYVNRLRNFQLSKVSLTESHTSLENGIMLRYPFLDNRVVDFTLAIPKALRSQLLFDKNILRQAFRDLLPSSFYNAPKFTVSRNLEISQFNVFKSVVYGNDFELLDQVFSTSKAVQETFDRDTVFQFAQHNQDKLFYPALYHLLKIINVGLLDIAFSNTEEIGKVQEWSFEPQLIKVENWEEQKTMVEKLMDADRYQFKIDQIVHQNKPINFLKDPEAEIYFLLANDELQFEIDNPAVYKLFKAIDGTQSIPQIMEQHHLEIDGLEEMVDLMVKEGYISNFSYEDY